MTIAAPGLNPAWPGHRCDLHRRSGTSIPRITKDPDGRANRGRCVFPVRENYAFPSRGPSATLTTGCANSPTGHSLVGVTAAGLRRLVHRRAQAGGCAGYDRPARGGLGRAVSSPATPRASLNDGREATIRAHCSPCSACELGAQLWVDLRRAAPRTVVLRPLFASRSGRSIPRR
jgi:hypothetical protein